MQFDPKGQHLTRLSTAENSVDSDGGGGGGGGVTVTKDQEATALRGQMLTLGKFRHILMRNYDYQKVCG